MVADWLRCDGAAPRLGPHSNECTIKHRRMCATIQVQMFHRRRHGQVSWCRTDCLVSAIERRRAAAYEPKLYEPMSQSHQSHRRRSAQNQMLVVIQVNERLCATSGGAQSEPTSEKTCVEYLTLIHCSLLTGQLSRIQHAVTRSYLSPAQKRIFVHDHHSNRRNRGIVQGLPLIVHGLTLWGSSSQSYPECNASTCYRPPHRRTPS